METTVPAMQPKIDVSARLRVCQNTMIAEWDLHHVLLPVRQITRNLLTFHLVLKADQGSLL